jgi:TP901 family phage tail tape measure protein
MLGVGLKVAAGVAATAVGGLAAGLASSVSDAADFQQGMADIQASMGASTEETAQLKNLILDLGIDPKLKVSAEEAAQAIGQLGTAGVSIDDIMNGAARSTVLLANATGADFADAASIASDVSKLWSIDAGDLTHAVDGITAATVASKFNINDYRLALAQAGGVASTVGVSFDDFNATIAAISPSFASGSDAGTSLKVLLQRLVPSSDKATEAMQELGLITINYQKAAEALSKGLGRTVEPSLGGVSMALEEVKKKTGQTKLTYSEFIAQFKENQFFDAAGNMKDMSQVVGLLNKAFTGLTEEQKNAALSTIFGTDAMRAAAAMAKMTTGDFQNLQATMAKTDAAESAKTRMDTLKGSLEILSGTFDTLKLMVGDKFLPVLNDLVKRFNDFLGAQAPMIVDWAGALATKLGDLVTNYLPIFITKLGEWWNWAKQLAGTLLDVGNQVWSFITGVKAALQPVIDFVARFVGLKEILLGVAAAFGIAAIASLASFVAALTPVVALLGTAVTVVTALYGAWTNNFAGIRDIVGGVLDYLYDRFRLLWDFIKLFGPGALEEIGKWVTGTQTQFDDLNKIWTQVKLTAQVLFNDLVSYVQSNLPSWISTLQGWGSAAWQWIVDATPTVLAKLESWGSALFQWALGKLPSWITTLQGWGNAAWQWIVDMAPVALSKLTGWGSALWGWVQSNWPTWKARLLDWGDAAWQWIADAIPVALTKLADWGTALLGWVQNNIPAWKAKMLQWGTAAWQWVVDMTPVALAKLGEWGVALWGWVQNNWPTWKTHLLDWGSAAWQWIKDMTPIAVTKLGEWATALFQWVGSNLPRWTQNFLGWTTAAVQWLGDAIPLAINKLNEWLDSMTRYSGGEGSTKLTEATNKLGDAIKKTLGEIAIALAGLALNIGTNIVLNIAQGLLDDVGIHTNLFKIKDDIVKELTTWDGVMKEHGFNMSKGLSDGFSMFNPVGGAIKAVTDIVSGVKSLLGINSPSTVFTDIGSNMIQGLINGLGGINPGQIMNTVFGNLRDAWNYWHDNLVPHFSSSAKDFIAGATNAFVNSNLGQAVNTAMAGLRDRWNYWHDDLAPHLWSSATDIANNVIGGLAKGIKDGVGRVLSSVEGITDALPQWVKDKLGIHSPSTVFAGLGQNIIAGLVEGMQSMAGAPQAVLSDMTAGMMTGAAGGTVTTNNTTSTTNNWNVTIPTAGGNQPVDQMQSMFNTLTTIYAG